MKYKTQKYANASRVNGSGTAMDWSPMKYADGGSVGVPSRMTKAAKPAMAKYADGGSVTKAAKPRSASPGASPSGFANGGRMRYAGGGYATSGRSPAGGRMRYAGGGKASKSGGYASKSKVYKSKRMKGYGE